MQQGTKQIYNQIENEITGTHQNYDLQRILQKHKESVVPHAHIHLLMGIDQCLFIYEQISHDRVGKIQQVDQLQMIHIGMPFDQTIQKGKHQKAENENCDSNTVIEPAVQRQQRFLLLVVAFRDRVVKGVGQQLKKLQKQAADTNIMLIQHSGKDNTGHIAHNNDDNSDG